MRLGIKQAQLMSATPFPYIPFPPSFLLLATTHTRGGIFGKEREQLKKLPVCPVMVQAIKNKRPPSFPSSGMTLVSAADSIIVFHQAPLPFSTSTPSLESLAKNADFKHLLGMIL